MNQYEQSNRISEAVAYIYSVLSFFDQFSIPMGEMDIFSSISVILRKEIQIANVYISRTITNLSADEPNRIPIMKSGILPLLLEMLDDSNIEVSEHVVMTLGNLAVCAEVANYISNIGGCEPIAEICRTLNEDLLMRSAKLVCNMCQYELPRKHFIELGVKDILAPKAKSSYKELAYYASKAMNNLNVPIRKLTRGTVISNDKAEKYFLKRIKIINEIFDTERTYCHHLNQCVSIYMNPLQGSPLITSSAHRDIFSSVDIIANTHTIFLEDLSECISTAALTSSECDKKEASVGPVFLRLVDCLRLYQSYISNYDKSINALSDCLEDPKFRAWVDEQHDEHRTLSLASILICPIQRIPRYSLLLQELLKHMSSDHPDFGNVNKALDGVLAVAEYLEEERGKTENANKVILNLSKFNLY